MKVTMEMHQVLNERGDLLIAVFGKIPRDKTFLNSITLLQMDRLQLSAVYCNRRGCKHNTSNAMFRGVKVCSKWLQERSDDQIIQPDNKFTIGLKVRIQFGTLCLRGDVARYRQQ